MYARFAACYLALAGQHQQQQPHKLAHNMKENAGAGLDEPMLREVCLMHLMGFCILQTLGWGPTRGPSCGCTLQHNCLCPCVILACIRVGDMLQSH